MAGRPGTSRAGGTGVDGHKRSSRTSMQRTIGELLVRNAPQQVFGREQELAALMRLLDADGPTLIYLHGPAGIGKSALLRSCALQALQRGAQVVALDGREVEPTHTGFLRSIAGALSLDEVSLFAIVRALREGSTPALIAIDGYESLGLLDSWLRRVFVPALPERVRLALAGRLAPARQWTEAAEWRRVFSPMTVPPLGEPAALELLAAAGLHGERAAAVAAIAFGHPLALTLAGRAVSSAPLREASSHLQSSLQELSRRFLEDIADEPLREAVRASCAVRRVTRPLLAAMLADHDGQAGSTLDRLAELPFFERARDGLLLHDAVREALAAELQAIDPERLRRYRLAAWRHLQRAARLAEPDELWRYTADLIYLVRLPIVRDAFFPRASAEFSVEPARPEDGAAISALVERHETPESVRLLQHWWQRAPDAFHVARAVAGEIVGAYVLIERQRFDAVALEADPLTARWSEHLRLHPIADRGMVLFLRRWLSRDQGEAPGPVQAALWLDIKRHYMALRPQLRRVYLCLREPTPYVDVAASLGMTVLPGSTRIGDAEFLSLLLDMGPHSVDGWLARLVGADLGTARGGRELLDRKHRRLRLADTAVPLTKREFDLIDFLQQRPGEMVAREELLQRLWGRSPEISSNVVDVVVASLRRKLGERASMLQTVRGHGYLLQCDDEAADAD